MILGGEGWGNVSFNYYLIDMNNILERGMPIHTQNSDSYNILLLLPVSYVLYDYFSLLAWYKPELKTVVI